jgi:hypothetical protein
MLFSAVAQERVAPENLEERVIAIVPFVGQGTAKDPKRPMFVPLLGARPPANPGPLLSWSMTPSDDGKFAIVVFTASDPKALEPILNANRPDVKVFIRGQHSKQEIEQELRRVKRDFNVDQLATKR